MKTNKRKKLLRVLVALFLITLGVTLYALHYVGTGFGDAVANTEKEFYELNEEWKEKEVNPIDSVQKQKISIQ